MTVALDVNIRTSFSNTHLLTSYLQLLSVKMLFVHNLTKRFFWAFITGSRVLWRKSLSEATGTICATHWQNLVEIFVIIHFIYVVSKYSVDDYCQVVCAAMLFVPYVQHNSQFWLDKSRNIIQIGLHYSTLLS